MLNERIKKYEVPVGIADSAPNLKPHETETYRFGEEEILVKEIHLQITHITFYDEGNPGYFIEKFGLINESDVEYTITHQMKKYEQENIKSIDLVILGVGNPVNYGEDEDNNPEEYYDPEPKAFLYTHKVDCLEEAEDLIKKLNWLS